MISLDLHCFMSYMYYVPPEFVNTTTLHFLSSATSNFLCGCSRFYAVFRHPANTTQLKSHLELIPILHWH